MERTFATCRQTQWAIMDSPSLWGHKSFHLRQLKDFVTVWLAPCFGWIGMQLRMLRVHVHLLQVVKTRRSWILCSSEALLITTKWLPGSYTITQETKGDTAYSWGLKWNGSKGISVSTRLCLYFFMYSWCIISPSSRCGSFFSLKFVYGWKYRTRASIGPAWL